MEAMAQKSGDASDQVTNLQCFNSKDMIKADHNDMEPGTFHLKKEDISCIQDELKMPLERKKSVANHA